MQSSVFYDIYNCLLSNHRKKRHVSAADLTDLNSSNKGASKKVALGYNNHKSCRLHDLQWHEIHYDFWQYPFRDFIFALGNGHLRIVGDTAVFSYYICL